MSKLDKRRVSCFIVEANGLKFMPNDCKNAGIMKSNKIIAIRPPRSELRYFFIHLLFDQLNNIFEPSRGGMGNKLNKAKKMLKNIMLSQNIAIIPLKGFAGRITEIFSIIADITANIKLAIIPADATKIMLRFLFCNLL